MNPSPAKLLVSSVLALLAPLAAKADILVDYTATPPPASADAYAPSTLHAGITATDIAPNAGNTNVTVPIESNGYPTGTNSGSPEYRYIPNTTTTTSTGAASAVSSGSYISFTITPTAGNLLDLSSLTFNVARGGAATPRGVVVQTSADNFASNLLATDIATQRPTYTLENLDLSGAAFQNLSSFTVRYFAYTPGTGQSLDTDDITINGAIIPEPSSIALLGCAPVGIAGCVRRRRA